MSTVNQSKTDLILSNSSATPILGSTPLRVKGQTVYVPSVQIEERTVLCTGTWLKIALVHEEELIEGDTVRNPDYFVSNLKQSGLKADIFTFAQRLPDISPKHKFKLEWESAAVVSTSSYSTWWKHYAEYSVRKAVNRSKQAGVSVRRVQFSDEFVRGVWEMYRQTPVRQGKVFWHYKKDEAVIRHELGNYLDRSVFLGAYYGEELIGSLKMTYVGSVSAIMQIFSASKHFDKRPNNALIAKAIELCEADGMAQLIYGNFVYYDRDSSLTEFKRRNGFKPVEVPRYYVPLTRKGQVALSLGLHSNWMSNVPQPVLKALLDLRRSLMVLRQNKAVAVRSEHSNREAR